MDATHHPERRRALVLIDFINRLDFDGGSRLLPHGLAAAHAVARLRRRADMRHVPVIYANDDFGHWRSDFRRVVASCGAGNSRGRALTRLLKPRVRDFFVLKPRHSAFYCTPLDLLLQELKVGELILTGIAADNCVHATAADAYIRGYRLRVPADCVASETPAIARASLEHMARVYKADVRPSSQR